MHFITNSDLESLDFAVTRFLMKLFRMSNTDMTTECQRYFGFSFPNKFVERRRNKLVNNHNNISSFQRLVTVYVML